MKRKTLIIALLATCLLGANTFADTAKKTMSEELADREKLSGKKVCSTDSASIQLDSGQLSFGKPIYNTVQGTVEIVGTVSEGVTWPYEQLQIFIDGIWFRSVKPQAGKNNNVTTDSYGNYKPTQQELQRHDNYKSRARNLYLHQWFTGNTSDWSLCE